MAEQVDTCDLISGFYGQLVADQVVSLALSSPEADDILRLLRLASFLGDDFDFAAAAWQQYSAEVEQKLADPTYSLPAPEAILVACELSARDTCDSKERAVRTSSLAVKSLATMQFDSVWAARAYEGLVLAVHGYSLSQDNRVSEAREFAARGAELASGKFVAETQFFAGAALMRASDCSNAYTLLSRARTRYLEDGVPVRALQCLIALCDCSRYGELATDEEIYNLLRPAQDSFPRGYRGRTFEAYCLSMASASRAVSLLSESDDWLDSLGRPTDKEVRANQLWQRGLNHSLRGEHRSAVRLLVLALDGLRRARSHGIPSAALHLAQAQQLAGLAWEETAQLSEQSARESGLPRVAEAARALLRSGLSSGHVSVE